MSATNLDGMIAELPSSTTTPDKPRDSNPVHNAMSQRIWSQPSYTQIAQYAPSLKSVGPTPTKVPSREANLETRGFDERPRSTAATLEQRFQTSFAAPQTRAVLREPVSDAPVRGATLLTDLRRAQAMSEYRAVYEKAQS